jgi:hypothetical protein
MTPTVAECQSIDVNWMHGEGMLDSGAVGELSWSRGGEPRDNIRYYTVAHSGTRALVLSYSVTNGRTDEKTEYKYPVVIDTTPCNFGGERPWFRCPGVVDGETCGRRVGKLHNPPLGELFLCRDCYDLGYRSSRRSRNPLKTAQFRYQRVHRKLAPTRTLIIQHTFQVCQCGSKNRQECIGIPTMTSRANSWRPMTSGRLSSMRSPAS